MSRKNNFSLLKWASKSLVVHSSIFTLLVSPLPLSSYAQAVYNQRMNPNMQSPRNTSDLGPQILQFVNGAANTFMQMQQQSFAAVQQARMYQSLQPQISYDKYFGCPIPQAISNFPDNACKDPIQSPQEADQYNSYADIAKAHLNFIDKMERPTTGRGYIGYQCIEEAAKRVDAGVQDRIDQITQLMTDLEKNNQLFRDQNKSLLNDLADLNSELHGGQGPKNSSSNTFTKTKDFSKLFSNSCKETLLNSDIKGTINAAIQKGGLLGLKENLDTTNQEATRYKANKASYERDISKNLEKIKADIRNNGVDSWISKQGSFKSGISIPGGVGQQKFTSAALSAQDYVATFNSKKAAVASKIKSITSRYGSGVKDNFSLPPMDAQFQNNFGWLVDEANSALKRDYINGCVTMNDKGVGLSLEQIVMALKYMPTKGEGSNEKGYGSTLINIMNAGSDLDKKLKELEKYQKVHGYNSSDMVVRYKDKNSKIVSMNPLEYLRKFAKTCESKFVQSNGNNDTKNLKKFVTEYKNLEADFATKMTEQIYDQVNSCGGNSYKTSSCNADMLTPNSASFCIQHANSCSAQIQGCYAQVEKHVAARTKKIETKAKLYNARIERFVTQQDALLNQVKEILRGQNKAYAHFFADANVGLPEGLKIDMPEATDSEYGVRLRGGGDLDFIKSLPKQLEKLKASLAEQKKKIADEVDKYIVQQKSENMSKERSKWEGLISRCEGKVGQYTEGLMAQSKQQQDAYQKQMEQYGEDMQEVQNFCIQYDNLKRNPAAGCDGDFSAESLYTKSFEISAYLAPEVTDALNDYRGVCASSQNEQKQQDEYGDDAPLLISMCDQHDDWDGVQEEIINNLTKKAAYFGVSAQDIQDYLEKSNADDDDLPKKLNKDYVRVLKNAHSAIHFKYDLEQVEGRTVASSKDYCKQFAKEAELEAFRICTAKNADNMYTCEKDNKAELLDENFSDLPKANSLNRKLRSIASVAHSESIDALKWTQIGQSYSESCMAGYNDPRHMANGYYPDDFGNSPYSQNQFNDFRMIGK